MWNKKAKCLLDKKFTQEKENKKPRKVNKGEMDPSHNLKFEIMQKKILPGGGIKFEAYIRDLGITSALDLSKKVNSLH